MEVVGQCWSRFGNRLNPSPCCLSSSTRLRRSRNQNFVILVCVRNISSLVGFYLIWLRSGTSFISIAIWACLLPINKGDDCSSRTKTEPVDYFPSGKLMALYFHLPAMLAVFTPLVVR